MVLSPAAYPWSCYHTNAHGHQKPVLSNHPLYERLGTTPDTRRRAYLDLFRCHIEKDGLAAIRRALNQELVLGTERFKDDIQALAQLRRF